MAIDEKFVTGGISKNVVSKVNQPRTRKKKRPKPWDAPAKKSSQKDDAFKAGKKERPLRAPLRGDDPRPTDNTQSEKKLTKDPSGDSKKTTLSQPSAHTDNSPNTVSTQVSDSANTDQSHMRDSEGTVSTHMRNSSHTVQTRVSDSGNTVKTHMRDSANTVATQISDSRDTVTTHMHDSADTVATQISDSKDTVATQIRDSADTIPTQIGDSNKIIPTQISDSGNTMPTKVPTQSLHSTNTELINFDETYIKYIRLSGNRKTIVDFLCKTMIDNNTKIISGITYNILAKRLNIKATSIRNTVRRIKTDGLMQVNANGSGPGTTITITVSDNLLKAYSKASLSETNMSIILAESQHSKHTSPDTITSSSSSSLYNNKKTTSKDLPEEWASIEIPDTLKRIGLNETRLKQVHGKGILSAQDVQESLEHMAYDINSGTAKKKNFNSPINILMSVLVREGMPYLSEAYVKALEEERELQKDLRERYLVAKKEIAQKKLGEKFEDYFKTLSDDQKNEIVAPNDLIKAGSSFQKMAIQDLFNEGKIS